MSAVTITAVEPTAAGYNLTDQSDATTLVAGSGNGVKFEYHPNALIVLINGTAGAAVYTLKVTTPAAFTDAGATVNDKTITVAAGKTWVRKTDLIFKNSSGYFVIECDVAGKVLVLDVSANQ